MTALHARSALATLPLSIKNPGDVVIVDGANDWPTEAKNAIDAGVTGVVIVQPRAAEFVLPQATSTIVVVDSAWASNPVTSTDAFRTATTNGSRLECRVIVAPGADFATALLAELALIRVLLAPVQKLHLHHRSADAVYAEGSTDAGVTIDVSIICTSAVPPSATVRLLTSDGSVELLIPSGDTAQPARLITVGPDGAVQAPTQYEAGHRASLRRLRDAVPGDELADLRHLHDDVLVVTAALRDYPADQASA
ncbi:hypothetical protein [Kribbella sp. NPDC049584]|uniref:hypothetical protein n=1 Tax=Kribbella sp. NPDC049584 TaxID=3154833 RepID=UPI003413C693